MRDAFSPVRLLPLPGAKIQERKWRVPLGSSDQVSVPLSEC